MEKEKLDFNTFLHELDSREELDEFNVFEYVNKYTIDDKDAQSLTYEYISFYSINSLDKLLENDNWVNKKNDYKIYLLKRVATGCSNLNKSQYLTILAKCFKSNVDEAWESLKVVFNEYLLRDKFLSTTKRLLDNLSYVGFSNKKYRDELYKFISAIISQINISDENLMFLLGWLSTSNKFKYQLTKIDGIFEISLSLVSKTKEPQKRKHIIELSLQILKKLSNDDRKKYATNKNELYELLADNEYSFILPDDPNNAAVPIYNHMFLRNILQWYTLAGNDTKAAKAEKELLEVKNKIIIPSSPVTIYTPEQIEVLSHILECAYSCPVNIFLYGLSDDFFRTIPSDTTLNKAAEDYNGPDGFSFTHLDYNYNSNNISDAEELSYKKFIIYDSYAKPSIKNFIIVFLQRIKQGTLCYKDIHDFLTINTNFGKTYRSYRNEALCYYDLIGSALKNLFYQFQKLALGNSFDFTLSIDSLCPKIERILREMAHSLNARILKIEAKSSTPKKETMILLDQILDAPELNNIMTNEDINFFKYVLTNNGLNIRNDSAHGLYAPTFYKSESGLTAGFMVFVTIIRLAVITNCFKYEENSSND